MLLQNKSLIIDDITVFYDHADPQQFWYLPGPVRLATRPEDQEPSFSFIKYKPAAVAGGVKGGGFLTFEVNLKLSDEQEQSILSQLSAVARGKLKLAAVPFDEGTVLCIALNLQGSGGTTASPAAAGTFDAVEEIRGSTVPSLGGDNRAAFSLTLSQEGSTILEQAFKEELTPIGVVYNLKYTAMRPALDVKITADFKRIFQQLSVGLEAQVYFVKAGIDAAFEKLVQDGVIKIEVINFTGEAEMREREKWALDFFKTSLLHDWFEPTLLPGQIAGATPSGAVTSAPGTTRPPTGTGAGSQATGSPGTNTAPSGGSPGGAPIHAAGGSAPGGAPNHGTGTPPAAGASGAGAATGNVTNVPPASGTSGSGTSTNSAATGASGAGGTGQGTVPPVVGSSGTGSAGQGTSLPAAGSSGSAGAAAHDANTPTPARTGTGTPATGAGSSVANVANAVTAAAGSASPAMVSFKLKFVKQEELKTLTFQYNEQEAVQETYAPPGFFGMMIANLDTKKHFLEVDLDDPFFRVFSVSAEAPVDFARIGLQSLQVALDYGNENDATDHKHADFVFDSNHKDPQKFEVFMNKTFDTSYRHNIQYHFDPDSSWEGDQTSYEIPVKIIEDRTLLLDPYNDIDFTEISIKPGKIDAGVIESTDVYLVYQNDAVKKEKLIMVLPNSPEQFWKFRTQKSTGTPMKDEPVLSYRLVHHLQDRTTREIQDVTTRATTVLVNDPFEKVLDMEFSPAYDIATVKQIFIDVEYHDEENAYNREGRVIIKAPEMDIVSLRFSIIDDKKKTFQYRVTVIGADGKIQQRPFVESDNPFIEVA